MSLMENELGLVVILVGLPARGKSYIVKKLSRYLSWMGFETKVFNVGDARRKSPGYATENHDFFSSDDAQARRMREEIAFGVLDSLIDWMGHDAAKVGVFDATNTTIDRRRKLRARCEEREVNCLFIESVCDDPAVLEQNINLKLQNNDYRNIDPAVARTDFLARVAAYQQRYQTIGSVEEQDGVRYLKLYNVGKKMTMHLCSGYLPGQIAMFLANCHIVPRKIFISRHGQSHDNANELLGGDSHLTAKGIAYAKALAKFLHELQIDNLTLWTSALNRTRETAKFVNHFSEQYGKKYRIVQSRLLNEIDSGSCTGMTYKQVSQKMPEEFKAREHDKLRYRYPHGGESYTDLIERLKPIIIELERYHTPVLVICHQAVMRVLLAYFIQAPQSQCPHIDCPLHQVVQLTPGPYECLRSDYNLEMDVRTVLANDTTTLQNMVISDSSVRNPSAGNDQVLDMYQAQQAGVGNARIRSMAPPALSQTSSVTTSPHSHCALPSPLWPPPMTDSIVGAIPSSSTAVTTSFSMKSDHEKPAASNSDPSVSGLLPRSRESLIDFDEDV